MTRQRVTVLKELPEFIHDEPRLSVKQRLRAQAEEQLSREEAELQSEYDRVISSASGPIAADWAERWDALRERRRAMVRGVMQAQAARNFQRQAQEDYLTPSMVLAPGQREQIPQEDQYIQGPRYPVRFPAEGLQNRSQHSVRITPVRADEQPPNRNGDVISVSISGTLRVGTDPVTGEQQVDGDGQTYYFGPPECIGHHTHIHDETIVVARSSDPIPVVNDIPAEQREEILENNWQSPVPGFGNEQSFVQTENARQRIRGLRADCIIVDEVGGQLAFTEMQALRAARAERNDQHWESMMQGQLAPAEDEVTASQRRAQNERLYQALEGPRARAAGNAINDYVRARIRDEGVARQILPPNPPPPNGELGFVIEEHIGTSIGHTAGLARVDFADEPAPQPEPRRVKRKRVIVRRPDEL